MKVILNIILLLPCLVSGESFYKLSKDGQPSHLTPLDVPYDVYAQRVADHLFLTSAEYGRFVVRPSFSAESSFSVWSDVPMNIKEKYGTKADPRGKDLDYFITLTKASENLFYSIQRDSEEKNEKMVSVIRLDRKISFELAVAIQRVWAKMLHQTKYPSRFIIGMDGVTYQFSVWVDGIGFLHGETWSPDKGLLSELVDLGEEVQAFTENMDHSEEQLIKKLKKFENKIQ